MEKMNITLTQDEIILELIKLLKQNQMQDKANNIFESQLMWMGLRKN